MPACVVAAAVLHAGSAAAGECHADADCGEGNTCSAGQCAPAPEPPFSRFYWHEAVGAGVFSAESSYTTGTRRALGMTFHLQSMFGVRVTRDLAIGGSLDLLPMPPLTVTEDRSEGHKEFAASFGWAGLVGPAAVLIHDRLRFDLSSGFFWCVTGPAEGTSGATLGGFGGGVGPSAAYEIPVGRSLALGFEGRAVLAAYVNGDSTHTIGWSLTGTALASLRMR